VFREQSLITAAATTDYSRKEKGEGEKKEKREKRCQEPFLGKNGGKGS
jgi:hypothetical protein